MASFALRRSSGFARQAARVLPRYAQPAGPTRQSNQYLSAEINDPLTLASPRVSVVIVTHNALSYLESCLTSLYAYHDRSQVEVIIVDNESTDGTTAWLGEYRPETQLISVTAPAVQSVHAAASSTGALRPGNRGFAAANNQGLAIARGAYLLILNPDTVFQEASCLLVADYLDEHPSVGAAACQLRNADGSIQLSCRAFPSLVSLFWSAVLIGGALPVGLRPAYYQMRFWSHNTERSVDQPAGAFFMVRRTVLDQVGPMDERFRLYYEDVDWCFRIKAAGWPIMFWPGTSVVHVGGASTHPTYPAAVQQMHLSMITYFQKHYGRRVAIGARLLSLLAALSHTVLWAIRYAILPTRRKWLRSMIGAHLRLFNFELSRLLGRSQ